MHAVHIQVHFRYQSYILSIVKNSVFRKFELMRQIIIDTCVIFVNEVTHQNKLHWSANSKKTIVVAKQLHEKLPIIEHAI